MMPDDGDFKLTDQMVQRMVDLLRDGISVEFIVQGLKFHRVHPALTRYLKGPPVCCQSDRMTMPDWISSLVQVDRLTTIIAEHRIGQIGQLATYADVLAYLHPAAKTQLLPKRWAAIYNQVKVTTRARHELLADEGVPQTSGLTAGQEARLLGLRQELRSSIVRLARQHEIAWPGRSIPVGLAQDSFQQLAQRQSEQTICLNLSKPQKVFEKSKS